MRHIVTYTNSRQIIFINTDTNIYIAQYIDTHTDRLQTYTQTEYRHTHRQTDIPTPVGSDSDNIPSM